MALEEGDKIPDFELPAAGGGTISSGDLRGQKTVIYFYPKDNTPGCTVEARDFTALEPAFEAAGTRIVGVSKDSVKKHDNFRRKQQLEIDLIADENGEILEAFGIWGQKKMYGRTFMGIERSTFLVDGDGVIRRVWRKVKVKGHAEEVLKAAEELD